MVGVLKAISSRQARRAFAVAGGTGTLPPATRTTVSHATCSPWPMPLVQTPSSWSASAWPRSSDAREAFLPWLEAAPHPERWREILLTFTTQPVRKDLLDMYCRNVSLASRAGLEGTIDMFYESIENQVRDIRTPTLIIAGEADPLFNREYVNKHVLPTTPGARAVFLPCGHEIPFEMPNETAILIEAYLAGLRASETIDPRGARIS